MAGGPPVVRLIVIVTAAIWMPLELRQSLGRRREAVAASWTSEVLFRIVVAVGALMAGVLSGLAPSATIRPPALADWIGLFLIWAASPYGCGVFAPWADISPSRFKRAVISQ
jgi:hypothetical protein